MPPYVRAKKIKDIETAPETLIFPVHPSYFSRGNAPATPEDNSNGNDDNLSDIRLN